ncbi:MAG: alpha-glucosidase C-terminal domain-containing protein, partial [Nitrososphaerota archaeon]
CGVNEMLIGTLALPKGNQYCQVYPSVTPVKSKYWLVKPDEWKNEMAMARAKQFLALALTLPVVPMFIMGTECGLSLLQADAVGPKWDYSPMLWDDTPNYGFSKGKPFVPVNPDGYPSEATVQAQLADPDSILNCFRKLAVLRKNNPALQANEEVLESYAKVPTQDDQKHYAFLRFSAKSEEKFLIVANLQPSEQKVRCDFGKTKHKIVANYEMINVYDDARERTLTNNKYEVSLPAYGFKILKMQRK